MEPIHSLPSFPSFLSQTTQKNKSKIGYPNNDPPSPTPLLHSIPPFLPHPFFAIRPALPIPCMQTSSLKNHIDFLSALKSSPEKKEANFFQPVDHTSPKEISPRKESVHSSPKSLHLKSSPLIKKPARPLIPTAPTITTLHSAALLALDSARLQTGERRPGPFAGSACVGTAAAAEGFGDAAEGVGGEVGLGRGAAAAAAAAAEAARGALFGGFEAFFDGEELGFESGEGVVSGCLD